MKLSCAYIPGQIFFYFFFFGGGGVGGYFFTSHWTNSATLNRPFTLQSYGNFSGGSFFIFDGSFLHFRGAKIARSPRVIFFSWYMYTCIFTSALHYTFLTMNHKMLFRIYWLGQNWGLVSYYCLQKWEGGFCFSIYPFIPLTWLQVNVQYVAHHQKKHFCGYVILVV